MESKVKFAMREFLLKQEFKSVRNLQLLVFLYALRLTPCIAIVHCWKFAHT